MILYAAYIKGSLVDQVAAETEDTALSKLRMDYPGLEGAVHFEIVDSNYREEAEIKEVTEEVSHTKPTVKIIEADKIEITINIPEGAISKEDLNELEKAAEEGMVVAKGKGV